ncbi:ly6/PLAUR domain-containing protein 1 isoform X1 [Heterocephalus glaber]|uniref:Ly6/PLAUR domain-containing protein 1 isoform X1 n=1 Tax=Heterocephalus glaber TaxID=10181 RepID=A0AAX6R7U6_HETGA|nr:ly6/PLAUR domain-containing protein 1 isoform X1 [Heterocephalus glaber]
MDAPWGSGVKGWEWAGLGVGAQTSSGGHADSGTTCCKAPRGRRKTAPWRPGNKQGFALQIQCYQCEEFQLNNDCSSPEFIVNCTVNVQDMCQKEVMEQSAGIMYRKSCASSAACLIASAGYQSFCSPGKLNSVCISCCNTPLCNGPRPKKRGSSASALRPTFPTTVLLLKLALFLAHC